MRLAITSDLHVDHHPQVVAMLRDAIRRREVDVLVVAGDITAHDDLLEVTLEGLRSAAKDAVFVPGNHDLWTKAGLPDSRERYETIVPGRVRNAGFVPLHVSTPPRICGHRFVGVTGWFDYSLRNLDLDAMIPRAQYEAGKMGPLQWSDKLLVTWPGDHGGLLDDVAICDEMVKAFEAQIDVVGDEPVVAITHHLPFPELVTSKGMLPWDFLNGFMGSARLGEAMRRAPGMKLAVCGHTHFRKDTKVMHPSGPLRALTSPLGYPREYRKEGQTLEERVAERVTFVDL